MNPRLDCMKQSPAAFRKLADLGQTAAAAGGVDENLRTLVDLRA